MAGRPGNPNHDPRTGRFTASTGLNVSNSTRGERVKANVKAAARGVGAFAGAAALGAASAIGTAAVYGVAKSVRKATALHTANLIDNAVSQTEKFTSAHANDVIKHISVGARYAAAKAAHAASQAGHVGTFISHVKRVKELKSHIAQQHASASPRPGPRRPMSKSRLDTKYRG